MRRASNSPVSRRHSSWAAVPKAFIPKAAIVAAVCLAIAGGAPARADSDRVTVTVHRLEKDGRIGAPIGTVTFVNHRQDMLVRPALKGLTPGAHGAHIHQNPNCGPATSGGKVVPGGAAGGHYDPDKGGHHGGPRGKGHRGDLPRLVADGAGAVSKSVYAPRLKVADIRGRALVVHAGGDNYADKPAPLGGGGGRVACAVIR